MRYVFALTITSTFLISALVYAGPYVPPDDTKPKVTAAPGSAAYCAQLVEVRAQEKEQEVKYFLSENAVVSTKLGPLFRYWQARTGARVNHIVDENDRVISELGLDPTNESIFGFNVGNIKFRELIFDTNNTQTKAQILYFIDTSGASFEEIDQLYSVVADTRVTPSRDPEKPRGTPSLLLLNASQAKAYAAEVADQAERLRRDLRKEWASTGHESEQLRDILNDTNKYDRLLTIVEKTPGEQSVGMATNGLPTYSEEEDALIRAGNSLLQKELLDRAFVVSGRGAREFITAAKWGLQQRRLMELNNENAEKISKLIKSGFNSAGGHWVSIYNFAMSDMTGVYYGRFKAAGDSTQAFADVQKINELARSGISYVVTSYQTGMIPQAEMLEPSEIISIFNSIRARMVRAVHIMNGRRRSPLTIQSQQNVGASPSAASRAGE